MSRILVLGFPGAGRKTLLGALENYFNGIESHRFVLEAQNRESELLMRESAHHLQTGFWPTETRNADINRYRWSFRVGETQIAELETLSYPAEVFQAYADRGLGSATSVLPRRLDESLQQFESEVRKTGEIFLLLNYAKLRTACDRAFSAVDSRDTLNQKRLEQKDVLSELWTVCSLCQKLSTLPLKPRITLLLTQCERYADVVDPRAALQALDHQLARKLDPYTIVKVASVRKTRKVVENGVVRLYPVQNAEPGDMGGLLDAMMNTSAEGRNILDALRKAVRKAGNLLVTPLENATRVYEIQIGLQRVEEDLPLVPEKEQWQYWDRRNKLDAYVERFRAWQKHEVYLGEMKHLTDILDSKRRAMAQANRSLQAADSNLLQVCQEIADGDSGDLLRVQTPGWVKFTDAVLLLITVFALALNVLGMIPHTPSVSLLAIVAPVVALVVYFFVRAGRKKTLLVRTEA